jgi:hypothetical protein
MNSQQRLNEAAARAKGAEDQGDYRISNREWRRYRLIQDAARDPEELLAEGVALSVKAMEMAASLR